MTYFLLLAASLPICLRFFPDPDLWGHLRFGRYFLEAGPPPQPDIFSYAADGLWIDHEWLCEILFFLAWRNFGGTGILLMKIVTCLGLGMFILYHANRSGVPLLATAVVFCVSVFGISSGMLVRPQLFTYLLTAVLLHAYFMDRDGYHGWLYAFPVISAFWANVHAGVVAGIGFMFLFCAGEAVEVLQARRHGASIPLTRPLQLAAALVISITATLATPYGPDYWRYLWHAVTLERTYITEWARVSWSMDNAADLIGPIVFSAAILLSRIPKKPAEILIFIVPLILGLIHMRHMMLFAISAGMMMAPHVADCFRGRLTAIREAESPSGGALTMMRAAYAAAILAILTGVGFAAARDGMRFLVDTGWYPVGATRFIRANGISGNLYPTFRWGEYAIWHLHPECLVGADGRYETVYSPEHERAQMAFDVGLAGWEGILDTHPTEIIMCPNRPLFRDRMASRPDWAGVYEDPTALVYLKRISRFGEIIDKAMRGALIRPGVAVREYFP